MSTKFSVPNLIPKIDKPWSPKLLANLNKEYDVKVARLRGSYIFHAHPETDELFYIISGTLLMKLKENESSPLDDLVLHPGDIFVVPKDVRHCPVAEGEDVIAMIVEKVGTLNSGDAGVVEGFTNQVEDVREKLKSHTDDGFE